MDDEWTEEDEKGYWQGVADLERWFARFFADNFKQVRHGSGDTLMDLDGLKERLENEMLEGVAHYGQPENVLFEKPYVELYGAICDIVERTYHGMPLDHSDGDDLYHTSKEARAAATRIFELLDLRMID